MKTRFRIRPDRISGRGGSFTIAMPEGSGEELGEEYSVENMLRTRESIGGKGEAGS